jgi:hypothetical protein
MLRLLLLLLVAESFHKWSQNETDWGFTDFISLDELLQPDRGFVVNDTVKIKVEITVQVRLGREVLCEVGRSYFSEHWAVA